VLAGGALIAVIAVFWASVRTLSGETPLSGADAYALGAPRAEEEQKRAVLRALKDLEFERSVGKISEEDYRALVAKYRAEAKRLLRILDTDALPRRAYVETLVAKRLRREGLLTDAPEVEGRADEEAEGGAPAEDDKELSKQLAASTKKKRGAAPKAASRKQKATGQRAEVPSETPEAPPKEPDAAPEILAMKTTPVTEPMSAAPACGQCSTVNDSDAAFCKKCGARLSGPAEQAAQADVINDAAKTPDDEAGA